VKHIFKPIRNLLRQYNQLSFLAAIYSLSNHLEWNEPLPQYLQQANPYGKQDKIRLGFFQWELDTLAREVLLHSQPTGGKEVRWNDVRRALNELKRTENEAFREEDYDIFGELTRIAHRQFHWQQRLGHADITRYRRIYRQPGMDALVQAEFGMSAEDYFLAAFGLLATFLKHIAITPEFPENATKFLKVPIAPLVDRMCLPLSQLKDETLRFQSLDIDWAYSFHPLRLHPLVRLPDGRAICPIPGLLARRFTDGLYFDFASNPDNLSKHLGPAFQSYVGDVLTAANQHRFTVLSEARFGSSAKPKDSVDWIVEDAGATLFIECKVLRLAHAAKASLAPIERELRKLARAIAQLYSTLSDALNGSYPHWKSSSGPIYPLLVTLDNWNLFTHTIRGAVLGMIEEEFKARGLNLGLLDAHPFAVCSIRELEMAIQVMHATSIDVVMSGVTKGEKAGYMFGPYLHAEFATELSKVRPLFPEEPLAMVDHLDDFAR
jgi:hypothetical protein